MGVQAADLMFSRVHFLPCGRVVCTEHVGLAVRPVLALLNAAMASVGKC